MSAIFDTLQKAIEISVSDDQLRLFLRETLDALHEISHQHEDWLNRDRHLRVAATKLSDFIEQAGNKGERDG